MTPGSTAPELSLTTPAIEACADAEIRASTTNAHTALILAICRMGGESKKPAGGPHYPTRGRGRLALPCGLAARVEQNAAQGVIVETIVADLIGRYERGRLSRRQLIQGLSMLVAGGAAAQAQTPGGGLRGMNIGHISVQVTDLQRSIDFYTKTFGLSVLNEDKPNKISRLGSKGVIVSLHQQPPTGIVDHFAINVEGFNKERVTQELKQRGIEPSENLDAGFHITDPDGVTVQIT